MHICEVNHHQFWCQAITWTNSGLLSIGPSETNFSKIWSELQYFSLEEMQIMISFGKWQPCYPCSYVPSMMKRFSEKHCSERNFNTLRPRQNGRHFADNIYTCIVLNENVWIPIRIPLKFVSKCPINNIPALVQIMAWRRLGDKPLSEPMLVGLLTHICVTRPQWVKSRIGVTKVPLVNLSVRVILILKNK